MTQGLGPGLGSEEMAQVKDVGRCWWHDTDTRLRCGPSESAISISFLSGPVTTPDFQEQLIANLEQISLEPTVFI